MYFFLSLKHTSNTFHEETQFSNISRYSCLSYNRYSRKRVVQRREFRDWLIQITSKKFRHTMRQCFKWGAYLEPRARESESEIRENENIFYCLLLRRIQQNICLFPLFDWLCVRSVFPKGLSGAAPFCFVSVIVMNVTNRRNVKEFLSDNRYYKDTVV